MQPLHSLGDTQPARCQIMAIVVRHKETKLFLCIEYDERLEREADSYCADAATRFRDESEASNEMNRYGVAAEYFEMKKTRGN